MGPTDISNMSSTSSSNQTLTVPKLQMDSLNWLMYSERVMDYLMSKGLKRHILGTAHKPVKLVKINGDLYKPGALVPLSDDKLKRHEKEQDNYEQKQASVCKVIYRTVDKSMFIQVKNNGCCCCVEENYINPW